MTDATQETDDRQLLREYTEHSSSEAFGELVRRHVDAVYSSALRRANGDRAAAEDIAQQVFTDFARKAPQLPPDTPPGGWLHRHTGFVASHQLDRERRRRAREQQAVAMNALSDTAADAAWQRTAPLLDAAMDSLPAPDRDALVLRFFEQRDFRAVGQALGVSDDTAQKRVARALEKLRGLLSRRGVTSTGAALSAIMLANAVTPAPAAMVSALSGHALAAAAASGGTLSTAAAGLTAAARWKLAAAAAALIAAGAVPVFLFKDRPAPPSVVASTTPASRSGSPETPGPGARPDIAAASDSPSLESLINAAARELRGGAQDITAVSKALALLTRIPAEKSRDAVVLASGVPDEAARALLYKYILSRWAETSPASALQYATRDLPDQHRLATSEGILAAWAARDPDAVLGWQAKGGGIAGGMMSDSLIASIFKSLASRDLTRALGYLEASRSLNDRAQALRGIVENVRTPQDRQRLLTTVDSLKDQELRTQTRRAVIETWARQAPVEAATWIEKAEPAWERPRLRDSLGLVWLQSDPGVAADWWISHEPGPDTLVKIINVWSQEDANAAGEWLRSQPAGPQSDAARMTFARQVADLDPESALTWAATVSDEAMRRSTSEHILKSWRARDPEAAARWESQTPNQTKP